jgi:hypothetical protein
MKRKIGGLVGLTVWAVLVYLIWEHLSGGEGVTRNVLRNTLLAILAPYGIYCLVLLFGSPKGQPSTSSKEPSTPESAPSNNAGHAGSEGTMAEAVPPPLTTGKKSQLPLLALLLGILLVPAGIGCLMNQPPDTALGIVFLIVAPLLVLGGVYKLRR